MFQTNGQALCTHTRLTGTSLYKGDPDATIFARLYPFLPQHFDLLLELIRTLARSTGGIGLRSAIRVIQDVLVDKSRVLPASTTKLALKQAWSHHVSKSKRINPHRHVRARRVGALVDSGNSR